MCLLVTMFETSTAAICMRRQLPGSNSPETVSTFGSKGPNAQDTGRLTAEGQGPIPMLLAGVPFSCISQGFPLSNRRRVVGDEIYHLNSIMDTGRMTAEGRGTIPRTTTVHPIPAFQRSCRYLFRNDFIQDASPCGVSP